MNRRTFLKAGVPLVATGLAGCTTGAETTSVSDETSEADLLDESTAFANADYLDSTLIIETDQYPHVNEIESQPVQALTVGNPDGGKAGRVEVQFGVTKYRIPIDNRRDGTYRVVASYTNEEGQVSAETLLLELGVGGVTILGLEVFD